MEDQHKVLFPQEHFLDLYNIDKEKFKATGLDWNELTKIFDDYSKRIPSLTEIGQYLINSILKTKKVHSVRFRVKDSYHLIEKIIRKKIDDPARQISFDNYTTEITDLVGVRAIHLFKESWIPIHKYITETFDLHEPPTAYFRKGDEVTHLESFQEKGCVIKEHPFGYRSIHFIVKSKPEKKEHLAEIQVRTIFEEAWSEIDHQIRYPYELDNQILNQFLLIFNRLAGSADEMGSFIKNLQLQLQRREVEILKQKQTIDELNKKVEQQNISQEEWTKMRDQIKSIKIPPLNVGVPPLLSLSDLIKNDIKGIKPLSSIYPTQKKFVIKPIQKKSDSDEKKE